MKEVLLKLFHFFLSKTFEDANENVDSGHSSQTNSSTDTSSTTTTSDDDSDHVLSGSSGQLSSNSLDDVNCPTLEESLKQITEYLGMTLDNRFHEAYAEASKWFDLIPIGSGNFCIQINWFITGRTSVCIMPWEKPHFHF